MKTDESRLTRRKGRRYLQRAGVMSAWIVVAVVALDSQAQRLQRTADACFADPAFVCLLEQALATLNESEYPDPDAMLEIGTILSGAGEIGRAQPVFMRALDSTMLMGWPEMRGAMFLEATRVIGMELNPAEARPILGHAESVARQMELPDVRALAMQAIAMNEIEAGRFGDARDALDAALDIALQVPWEEMRRSQFTMLVDLIVGELPEELARPAFEHALDLADDVVDGLGEGVFWAEMAAAQARLGDIDAALEIADGIRNAAWRSGARIGIAGALAARGESEQALAIASGLEERQRSRAIFQIALALVDRGASEQALELGRGMGAGIERDSIFASVARAALDAGDLDQALTVAAEVADQQTRTLLVIDLVHGFADRGIGASERQNLTDAVFAARELVRSGPGSSTNLHNLVSAFARLGEVDEAFATIDEIDDPRSQISARANLANALASKGDTDRAMEVVTQIEASSVSSYQVGRALGAIAAARAAEGDVDEALALVGRIEEAGIRATVLARIAVSLPE